MNIVIPRDPVLNKIDAVIHAMLVAQNEVRENLTPLLVKLGTKNEPSDADIRKFWDDRMKKATDDIREAVA